MIAGLRCDQLAPDSYTYSRECRHEVKLTKPKASDLPLSLFKEFKELKPYAGRPECRRGFSFRATHTPTGRIYTAWYTGDDNCDGGNTFGVFVRGVTPDKKRVVRLILDSDLYQPGDR